MNKQKMPNPNVKYPLYPIKRVCFLKNIINNPRIIIGDYTYYDDPDDIYNFEKNVLYLFDSKHNKSGIQDKLIIGKFCQIASGVRFITNGANHSMEGFSTYPFKNIGGKAWNDIPMNIINKGDTIVGNDVWIGNSATFMQGVKIGHGSIIGTNSLVTKDVEPYTIVGGNPAKVIRKRFRQEIIDDLLNLSWWDWRIDKITKNLQAITTGDLEALQKNI